LREVDDLSQDLSDVSASYATQEDFSVGSQPHSQPNFSGLSQDSAFDYRSQEFSQDY